MKTDSCVESQSGVLDPETVCGERPAAAPDKVHRDSRMMADNGGWRRLDGEREGGGERGGERGRCRSV